MVVSDTRTNGATSGAATVGAAAASGAGLVADVEAGAAAISIWMGTTAVSPPPFRRGLGGLAGVYFGGGG